ncbi:hypothetical protein I4641_10405 [Waterburya agarophytonicola K14]|uniref:Lipoprotein n=1 Tax=Waterburya agarophytonicola KI4 TaxID=2874699 RepID=A0A964FFT8_9CYAN|nr:hypothetical protein [Waterburya agarophytonicola]MCC0177387.1 hypothetical protein [Waterburya agarophytonicola KI4]
MSRLPKIFYLTCFLLLFLSCSKNQTTSSSVRASNSSYRYESKNINPPQDPAIARFVVAPEIAIMGAEINTTASSFDEVIELMEINSQKVINSVAKIEGCSAKITDYQHPGIINYSKAVISDTQKYSSSMKLEILISFDRAKDIRERIEQMNNCLGTIPQLKLEDSPENKNKSIYLALSNIIPTIKDGGKYRQKILEAKFKPLKEVASFDQPPTQFDAADTKCTSKGIVRVVDRSLSGIELDVDFDCSRLTLKQIIPVK